MLLDNWLPEHLLSRRGGTGQLVFQGGSIARHPRALADSANSGVFRPPNLDEDVSPPVYEPPIDPSQIELSDTESAASTDIEGAPPSYPDSHRPQEGDAWRINLIKTLKSYVSQSEAWEPVSKRTVPYDMTEEWYAEFHEFGERAYDEIEEARRVTRESFRNSVPHLNKTDMFKLIRRHVTDDRQHTRQLQVLYDRMFEEKRIPTPEPEAQSQDAGIVDTSQSTSGGEA